MSISNSVRVVTPNDLSPAINIITWFLLIVSVLAVFARVGIMFLITKKLRLDDGLIFASLILASFQAACVTISTGNGYGQPVDSLSQAQETALMKSRYAAEMLFIGSIGLAKLCSWTFVILLIQRTRFIEWTMAGFVVAWAVAAEFAVGFQCGVPRSWNTVPDHPSCFNTRAWWNYFGITNILTELALIIVPISIVLPVQMRKKKKAIVSLCFMVRIFVILAIIQELYYRNTLPKNDDGTLPTWKITICVQTVQCFAILAACAPQIKPFLECLQSTGLKIYHVSGPQTAHGEYSLSHVGSVKNDHKLYCSTQCANETVITAAHGGRAWDAQSQSSQSRMIYETKTWVVEEQYISTSPSDMIHLFEDGPIEESVDIGPRGSERHFTPC